MTNLQKAVACALAFTLDLGLFALTNGPGFMVGAVGFGIAAVLFIVADILQARAAALRQANRLQAWKAGCKRE